MVDQTAEEIHTLMMAARADTLRLFDLAREEDLHLSPGFGFRPIIWHLAHVGVFEAYWILQKLKGESAPDERYLRIFDPISTPREESKHLPSRREMEQFLRRVRERVWRVLEEIDFTASDPLLRDAYVFHLVLQHEYQHQETLCYLLHLLNPSQKTRPRLDDAPPVRAEACALTSAPPCDMAVVPAGSFAMGSVWNRFAYDNELPPHDIHLPAFKIDRLLTTNEDYASFIQAGGYQRREWWSDDGWAWREREGWECPLYWAANADGWRVRTMFDEDVLSPQHPVIGVSWYEAEAYARFAGKRLPSEAEWEKAASWDPDGRGNKRRYAWGNDEPTPALCNFHNYFWSTTPVGTFPDGGSLYGCLDMTGNVWEWTADAFASYPGFAASPYPEYSEIWFDGDHRVLKGGSWATRAPLLRTSFRNFFRRHFRIAFAGIRCAADL